MDDNLTLLKLIEYKIDTAKFDISMYGFLSPKQIEELHLFIIEEQSNLQNYHLASMEEPVYYNKPLFLEAMKSREKCLKKEIELLTSALPFQ